MNVYTLNQIPTIRNWFETFRLQLPEDETVLDHLVQLDEAYFGGKQGKALFMAKEVGQRKIAYQLINHTNPTREHAWWFLKTYIKPESALLMEPVSTRR